MKKIILIMIIALSALLGHQAVADGVDTGGGGGGSILSDVAISESSIV